MEITSKELLIMDEIRGVKEDIQRELDHHRADIKELRDDFAKMYTDLSKDFSEVRDNVKKHNFQIGTFAAGISVIFGSISAWLVAKFTL
jgi:hypothetical protein